MKTFVFIPIVFGAVVGALLGVVIWHSTRGPGGQLVYCKTNGAQLNWATHDNNKHITFWCVKNGRVVQ